MSIINITDRERELEHALLQEQRLNSMGAEREYVLRGKIEQLERTLGQSANMIQITAMERDWLKAQLGDLPNSQAEMMCEIKVLRDALALAKDLTTIVRMPNVEYIADAHNKAVKKIQAALTRSKP